MMKWLDINNQFWQASLSAKIYLPPKPDRSKEPGKFYYSHFPVTHRRERSRILNQVQSYTEPTSVVYPA